MYMYVCNFHFVNERECIFFTQFDIFPGQMSYVNNEEMYRDEQFNRLSRSTYSFIYVINEFT
jgi:hypothetical protein